MRNDGTTLEALVSFAEEQFLPEGLTVRTREKVFEDGVQVAEFDIVIVGKVGTADFSWLIECRDRPSEGAASASWIEQLAGRKQRFNFDKVTAVSTTGFSEAARSYAAGIGIETREVKSLAIDAFKDWIATTHMVQTVLSCELTNASIDFSEDDLAAHGEDLRRILIEAKEANTDFLRRSATGESVSLANAFRAAVELQTQITEAVEANGPSKTVGLAAAYTNDDDHFVVELSSGPVRVRRIRYVGSLTKTEFLLPVTSALEYRGDGERTISQVVAFQPIEVAGTMYGLEFHRMPDIEQAFVVLRTSKRDA